MMSNKKFTIPFNKPFLTGNEIKNIGLAQASRKLSGNGEFTKECESWITNKTGANNTLLVHSCTAALELAAIVADIKPGDEIIMPSFTFVSTANAFVLRGGIPVFIDIRPDTLNINENLIEQAITPATKAIVPVHYAGVACEMDSISSIAKQYSLLVIEDAAQALLASYKSRMLGSIGDLAAFSFHETKNIISGEGGALAINNKNYNLPSEISREKGTNRVEYFRGEIDKYTWIEMGSSYLPAENVAAFLYAQLEKSDYITKRRIEIWNNYYAGLKELEERDFLRLPSIPKDVNHNGHIFYILTKNLKTRTALLAELKQAGIHATFHYIPLHDSPGGIKYCKNSGSMIHTNRVSDCIIRLPMFFELNKEEQDYVINNIYKFFKLND